MILKNQNGNVLFIILIAVALFAALSYAVMSSTRSGDAKVSKEQSLISTASLIQYPAQIRSALQRMILSQRLDITRIEFNKPDDLGSCTSNNVCIFHPEGGNAPYINLTKEVLNTGAASSDWWFTSIFEVGEIGTSVSTSGDGNDILMVASDISREICVKLHEKLGLADAETSALNDVQIDLLRSYNLDNGWTFLAGEYPIGVTSSYVTLAGQPQGCFISADGTYYYYSILLER